MKEFPNRLNVNNKNEFEKFNYDRNLCYLRRNIFEHIISKDENSYFELDKFSFNYLNNNNFLLLKMKDTIISELENLGWKCKTSFGDTGLFIYSTEDIPPSCFEDGL
jgi:hypothetical protein